MKILLMITLVVVLCFSSLAAKCSAESYEDWEYKYTLLSLSYNDVKTQRDIARGEVKKLELAVIDTQASHASTLKAYEHLKADYVTALRYIDMAEYILFNMEIDFVYMGEREIK